MPAGRFSSAEENDWRRLCVRCVEQTAGGSSTPARRQAQSPIEPRPFTGQP